MTPDEALHLCRIAKGACPQQAIDEYTPDAWHLLLNDLRFVDARDALVAIAKRQPFVAPAEIRSEVRRIRANRITEFGPFDPPEKLKSADYGNWLGETRRRIADGELTDPAELETGTKPRDVPNLRALMRALPPDVAAAREAVE